MPEALIVDCDAIAMGPASRGSSISSSTGSGVRTPCRPTSAPLPEATRRRIMHDNGDRLPAPR